jgi:hypothetical protein
LTDVDISACLTAKLASTDRARDMVIAEELVDNQGLLIFEVFVASTTIVMIV